MIPEHSGRNRRRRRRKNRKERKRKRKKRRERRKRNEKGRGMGKAGNGRPVEIKYFRLYPSAPFSMFCSPPPQKKLHQEQYCRNALVMRGWKV